MEQGRQQPPSGSPSTWGARLKRHRSRPPTRALIASVALHAFVVAAFWLAGLQLSPEPDFVQYRVTLVSPPPQEAGEPEPAAAPETPVIAEPEPEPEPPAPEPEPEEPEPAPPEPEPAPPTPPTATETPEEKEPEPVKGPDPKPSPTGGENLNIQRDGEEFLFPEYQANIIRQLNQAFRWNGAPNLEAEVVFYIQRDGSVGGLRIVRKSGNFQFDLNAHEAVDAVGRTGRFGPLPDGWQQDRLWVSFTFEPQK